MSEFGIKIKNIEASTLYEYNNGVRDHYEYKDAMFTNSLFGDYLKENGLKVWKEESTRDLICLEFNFGSRSYEEEIEHLKKVAVKARTEYKIAKSYNYPTQIQKKKNKRHKLSQLFIEAKKNKEKYQKHSKEDIRKIFYNDGVNVEYITRKKNGDIVKREMIHYKMLYRSTGKAKKGSCMFICDRLYKKAIKFLYMGIKLPKKNSPIVEISAYAPLISSAIVGKIKINPKNILILKDVDRYFNTKVVAIKTDKQKQCYAEHINNYKLKNTLFDGQALIDSAIFPSWGNGYVLLRHHFCKMAAFSTNIQQFFKDYFKDDYYSATVKDMFGNEHYVKDIELITTDNAMKWLKFDISYDYWCERVYENNCMFGIVKTAHESKLGEVQRMSYQMVNCLDNSIMENVVKESVEYINKLKQNDDFFLKYLEQNKNFSNDFEVLIALCNQNRDFLRSSYFRRRRRKIIETYVLNMKSGKIIQNAENLVVVGSPYAMLLYAASGKEESVDDDDTFFVEPGTIQCYTERFNSGEYLAFFRSPFNSQNNLTYLHNTYHRNLEKYFNLGRQCIAINMNGTDAQDRNNGMDMDSDSGYTTNQPDIVEHAKNCYSNSPTIVTDYVDLAVGTVSVIGETTENDGKVITQAALKAYITEKLKGVEGSEAIQAKIDAAKDAAIKTATETASEDATKKVNEAKTELQQQIDTKIASVFRFKGAKENLDEVKAVKSPVVGDVYHTNDDGKEYVYTGTEWELLGFTIDLSPYATKKEVTKQINDKVNEILGSIDAYTKAEVDQKVKDINAAIDTAKQAAIDAAATDATTKADQALKDAKAYADGLNGAMDTRVKATEKALTWVEIA